MYTIIVFFFAIWANRLCISCWALHLISLCFLFVVSYYVSPGSFHRIIWYLHNVSMKLFAAHLTSFKYLKSSVGEWNKTLCFKCLRQDIWRGWIISFDRQFQRPNTLPDYLHAVYQKEPGGDLIWQVVLLHCHQQESGEHILFAWHCLTATIILWLILHRSRIYLSVCSMWCCTAQMGEKSTGAARVGASHSHCT